LRMGGGSKLKVGRGGSATSRTGRKESTRPNERVEHELLQETMDLLE